MIAADDEDATTTDGFEVSVDEGAYLIEHLDLTGLLPEVLALYNPMTGPDLADTWKTLQRDRLTQRGILAHGGVLPEVATLIRTIAHADETVAIRVIPLHQPDTMLRVAIATHFDRFVTASRSRDILLVQRVPASDWVTATTAVIAAVLGATAPAPLSEPVQLTAAEAARIAAYPPGQVSDLLTDHGLTPSDAAILNAASSPDVATELTALRRVDGVTRRTKTAVSLLDTEKYGRIIAWPQYGPDHQQRLTYAPMSTQRLDSALNALLATLDSR
jgi:hypothetical protein